MLFVDRDGEGVEIEPNPHRQKPVLDGRLVVFARAETWERYRQLGFTVATIGSMFGLSVRVVHTDLKALRDARAGGDGGASLLAGLLTEPVGQLAGVGA